MRKLYYFLLFGFGAAFSDDTDYPEVDIFLLFKIIKIQYAHYLLEIVKIKITNRYIDFQMCIFLRPTMEAKLFIFFIR